MHVNSTSNKNKPTAVMFKGREAEKRRKIQHCLLDVEMVSFTPLVFVTDGGTGSKPRRKSSNLTV